MSKMMLSKPSDDAIYKVFLDFAMYTTKKIWPYTNENTRPSESVILTKKDFNKFVKKVQRLYE